MRFRELTDPMTNEHLIQKYELHASKLGSEKIENIFPKEVNGSPYMTIR